MAPRTLAVTSSSETSPGSDPLCDRTSFPPHPQEIEVRSSEEAVPCSWAMEAREMDTGFPSTNGRADS